MSNGYVAPGGRCRYRWRGAAPEFADYRDKEWGNPATDDVRLFETIPADPRLFRGQMCERLCALSGPSAMPGRMQQRDCRSPRNQAPPNEHAIASECGAARETFWLNLRFEVGLYGPPNGSSTPRIRRFSCKARIDRLSTATSHSVLRFMIPGDLE